VNHIDTSDYYGPHIITRTCQLQQINALVYLTAPITAHRRHQKVVSL